MTAADDYTVSYDEVETAFHEFAAQLTQNEIDHSGIEGTSYPAEFADWQVAMKAFQRWYEAEKTKWQAEGVRRAARVIEVTERCRKDNTFTEHAVARAGGVQLLNELAETIEKDKPFCWYCAKWGHCQDSCVELQGPPPGQ